MIEQRNAAGSGMPQANLSGKVPTLLDRALLGLFILVVLVLLGMEVVLTGGPPG